MIFTWPPLLLACGFSALIGVGFGFFPPAPPRACSRWRRWRENEPTLVCGLVMLSLSACGWRPIDATAPPSLPPQWRVVDERSGSLRAGIAWWENFNDPQLSALIDGMLIANQDLALAGLQWREAMLEAGLAQGNLTPDLAANLSGRNTRALRARLRRWKATVQGSL